MNNKKDIIVDEINGIKIPDPYRWLEDAKNPDVQNWVSRNNNEANEILKNEPFRSFSDELEKNFKLTTFSNPVPVQGKYFYTERQPDEDQMVLYMKKGLGGTPLKLVDPNGKRDGNTVTIDFWYESKTGNYIAYGMSEGGNEMATLYVKDTNTNKNITDEITNCRYSVVRWTPDDSGFFYTRNPRKGTVPKNEEHLHTKVYFHKLGDNSDNDELIFGTNRPKDDMIGISLSPDGKYLGIQVSKTWTESEIYIYNTLTKETKGITREITANFSIFFLNNKVLLYTNYKANNYRILQFSYEQMYSHPDEWEELVPEKEFLLENLYTTKSKILISYLVNACSEVYIFDHEGKEIEKIPLPKYSSLAGISTRMNEEEFFYGVYSFVFPKITFRYNPETKTYEEYKKIENPINPEEYIVKQEWYTSKDGTKVPMFIFHKKETELNSSNPTILSAYGGFGNNQSPLFMRNWVPWVKRGGIFAIANIRGGGEFGEKWHKDGIKENKQNSFDDFIAAGEYLIARKYTNSDHLGTLGGSNGGLLVSATAIQCPELFKAVCSRVPLTDMVRFPKFGIAIRWIHEYGDPDVIEDLQNILKWSPYHNVKENIEYPNFLFTTADKDTRVDPLHARKMAARLKEVNKKNQVLILTETEAGHGPGKPIAKVIESQAMIISFFAKTLGLK